jgi:pyridoxamine 5'-phosphate oxidase
METIKIDGIEYNLADLEKDCWVRLLNGLLKGRDPLHNATIANTNLHGVNMRTVVLRKVNTLEKTVAFHTDIRSGKWNELQENNNISWLFYDAAAGMQIRLAGKVTLYKDNEIADEAWLKSNPNSRKIYMGEIAPSKNCDLPTSGVPDALESNNPSLEETEVGRKNFGIVITKVNWMEWLWLNSKGHRRASFTYNKDYKLQSSWLIP